MKGGLTAVFVVSVRLHRDVVQFTTNYFQLIDLGFGDCKVIERALNVGQNSFQLSSFHNIVNTNVHYVSMHEFRNEFETVDRQKGKLCITDHS